MVSKNKLGMFQWLSSIFYIFCYKIGAFAIFNCSKNALKLSDRFSYGDVGRIEWNLVQMIPQLPPNEIPCIVFSAHFSEFLQQQRKTVASFPALKHTFGHRYLLAEKLHSSKKIQLQSAAPASLKIVLKI